MKPTAGMAEMTLPEKTVPGTMQRCICVCASACMYMAMCECVNVSVRK